MSNTFPGQFPITAPDLAVSNGGQVGGQFVDADDLMSETTSEAQNLQQDLTNRLVELPGSNLDFGTPNTRGVGIMSYLSAPSSKFEGLPARIDAEFIQDPRVTGSFTPPLAQQPDGSYIISTQVTTVAGVLGLSWAWSAAGVAPLPMTS
jgi:hypothetical protein